MSWKINSFLLIGLLLFSCNAKEPKENLELAEETPVLHQIEPKAYFNSNYLIEAEDLLKLLNQNHVKVIDFRKEEAYSTGHIKGALNIWRPDIEDASYPYGGMMANKEKVEALLSRLGVQADDLIVVYDNKGSSDAARFWWLLQNYDFDAVKILNGGLSAWEAMNGTITNEIQSVEPSAFVLPDNPSWKFLISKDKLAKRTTSTAKTILLDTRSADEHSGKRHKKGAAKGGRIPNSAFIDWAEAIDYNGTKKFKSYTDLKDIYSKLNASKNDSIVVYCHTGVRSAHTTFVLTQLLGYQHVKNYDGSWTEWSHFEELPFEQDSISTINN